MKLVKGQQIVYVPDHAKGQVTHPDCESGFVDRVSERVPSVVFCRYWNKSSPTELRTKANSEGTPISNIIVMDTVPQIRVRIAIDKWGI